jgi:hypothetical protein
MANKIEQQYWGSEPPWDHLPRDPKDPKIATQYCRAVQWYHNMSDTDDHKKWVIEWMSDNKYKADALAAVKKLADVSLYPGDNADLPLGIITGPIARMLTLGAPLMPQQVDSFRKAILTLIEKGKKQKDAPAGAPAPARASVRDYVKDQVRELIEEIELVYDSILLGKPVKWECSDFIKSRQVKPMQAHMIADWFDHSLQDIKAVIGGSADDQLKEGYSVYTKSQLKKCMAWLTHVVDTCREMKRPTPIRRVRRRKSPIDRVKSMKWKKSDTDLGVESIHPSRMIGASKVVLFNTKTRVVTLLEAENADGLDVKGTSVVSFDSKGCKCKKVRKPKEFIKAIKDGGIRAFKNAFDALKTDEKIGKGRTNEDTIILTVYK